MSIDSKSSYREADTVPRTTSRYVSLESRMIRDEKEKFGTKSGELKEREEGNLKSSPRPQTIPPRSDWTPYPEDAPCSALSCS